MSLSLTNVQQVEFDNLVKMEYRSLGWLLKDTVRIKTDITGGTAQFRRVGQVIANQVGFQQTIAIQDPGFVGLTAILLKYAAATATDEIQDLTVNFDSKKELAMIVATAIGRRSDQIILDTVQAGATAGAALAPQGGNAVIAVNDGGGANTNFTFGKLRTIQSFFGDKAVPIGERYVAMSANNLRALMDSDRLTSRFYTSNDAVADPNALNYKDVLSVNIRVIPQMNEGGLVIAGNIRQCLAWHKMSMGYAIGMDLRTEINYLPRETTWFVNALFYAGAVAVDPRGIMQINCDETVNP